MTIEFDDKMPHQDYKQLGRVGGGHWAVGNGTGIPYIMAFIEMCQTCQPLIKENLDTHEKISGDSTKNSEILLFSRLRLIKPCFHWGQSLSVFSKCYLRSFICFKL